MAILVLLLLVFFPQRASTQDRKDWVSIDCGSMTSYSDDNGVAWKTDDDYIKTGVNKQVINRNSDKEQLNTLRVFTEQNKNCYTLPTPTPARYLIRATFYYGNYDGLSQPPSFALEFDGNKWDTVVTTMDNFTYYEMVYATRGDNVSVCLALTSESQFPFISMLEALPLSDDMYAGLARDIAWFKGYRFDYGTTEQIYWFDDDDYNRIWEPAIPSGMSTAATNFTSLNSTTVDDPPVSVMTDAIEAPDPTDTISLKFEFIKTNRQDHVIIHLTEVELLDENQTRSFDFYVNNEFVLTTTPEYESCTGAWQNTHSIGTLEVELRPTSDSTMPPILNAIEIYMASDPLVTTRTSKDDLNGLEEFIKAFQKLEGWSGEPCLPSDTVWQWLTCNNDDPPRVTALKLSGYSLKGPIPEFSQMEALESIDLSHNSLNGPIPDFLGELPNLKLLDLSYNNLTGAIPRSITNNKNIILRIEGNPTKPEPKHKRLGRTTTLLIGLAGAIGILAVVITVIYCFLQPRTKRKGSSFNSNENYGETGSKDYNGTTNSTNSRPCIPFAAIQKATKNFDNSCLIGRGGFGKVYKGVWGHGIKVAIKRGDRSSHQGLLEFQAEIEILSQFRHSHLVSLMGYCDEGEEMILVYEYMENGPLQNHLYGSSLPSLDWKARLNICIGAARGLLYLHSGGTKSVIHRDVKSANILLDEHLTAKVADFGISRRGPEIDKTHVSTAVKGSFGYVDPEYFRTHQLTEKSDVYSFGMVLFEVLCAKPVLDLSRPEGQVNLGEWAIKLQQKGQLEQIIDPTLAGKIRPKSLKKFVQVASECLANNRADRPSMREVLKSLEHALRIEEVGDHEGEKVFLMHNVKHLLRMTLGNYDTRDTL